MPSRLKILTLLAAWFLATGAQWDLAQVLGWGGMFARYSTTMSFSRALARTFSGEELCGVCLAVAQAKESAPNAPAPADFAKAKLLAVCPAAPVFVFRLPARPPWPRANLSPATRERPAPPTPPPRAV